MIRNRNLLRSLATSQINKITFPKAMKKRTAQNNSISRQMLATNSERVDLGHTFDAAFLWILIGVVGAVWLSITSKRNMDAGTIGTLELMVVTWNWIQSL